MKTQQYIYIILLFTFILLFHFFTPFATYAEILFEDNFDSQLDLNSCDGLIPSGWDATQMCDYNLVPNHYQWHITSDAAYGQTGKGFRQYWDYHDGTNPPYALNSSLIKENLGSTDIKEFYVRWYWRHQPGWDWGDADRLKVTRTYINQKSYILVWAKPYNGDTKLVMDLLDGDDITSKTIWDNNDSNWHCFELHFKINSPYKSDGIVELWIDGVLEDGKYGLNFGSNASWERNWWMGGNISADFTGPGPNNEMWTDYDNFVISTEYIGPVQSNLLDPPKNLRIIDIN